MPTDRSTDARHAIGYELTQTRRQIDSLTLRLETAETPRQLARIADELADLGECLKFDGEMFAGRIRLAAELSSGRKPVPTA